MILNETIINGSSMHQRGQVRVSINAPMVIVLPVSFFRRFRCYCRSLNCPSVACSFAERECEREDIFIIAGRKRGMVLSKYLKQKRSSARN